MTPTGALFIVVLRCR